MKYEIGITEAHEKKKKKEGKKHFVFNGLQIPLALPSKVKGEREKNASYIKAN